MEDKKYSKLKASFETTQPRMPDGFTNRVMKRIEQPDARCGGIDPTENRRARWLRVSISDGDQILRSRSRLYRLVVLRGWYSQYLAPV